MDPSISTPAAVIKSQTSSPISCHLPSPRSGNRPIIPIEPVEVFSSASSVALADSLVDDFIPHPVLDPALLQGFGHCHPSDYIPHTMEQFPATHGLQYGFGGGSHESSPAAQSIGLPQNGAGGDSRSYTPGSSSSSRSMQSPPPTKKPAFSGNRAFNPNISNGLHCAESSFFYRNPNPAVRQRTAQACEKCRDRKTKVSHANSSDLGCADYSIVLGYTADVQALRRPRPHLRMGTRNSLARR